MAASFGGLACYYRRSFGGLGVVSQLSVARYLASQDVAEVLGYLTPTLAYVKPLSIKGPWNNIYSRSINTDESIMIAEVGTGPGDPVSGIILSGPDMNYELIPQIPHTYYWNDPRVHKIIANIIYIDAGIN